jgi:hypothetical protein
MLKNRGVPGDTILKTFQNHLKVVMHDNCLLFIALEIQVQ